MNYKKRAIIASSVAVIAAILPAFLLVVYVDPFQIYHKPFISGVSLQENQRYQNAGLINSYLADPEAGYDSVIIGTSMSQNFTDEMVNKNLGWKKSLRLLMPGALADEQIAVLQHALHTGNVKHVLLEIHPFLYQDSYRQKKYIAAEPSLYFPRFLYNEYLYDDMAYIFNVDVLKISWRALIHQSQTKALTPETIGYWGNDTDVMDDHSAFNGSANLDALKKQTAHFSLKSKNTSEIESLDYPVLTDVLFPLLNHYCDADVEMVMFVPPWPRFRYQKSQIVTLRSVYMMRYILKNIEHCKNISLYNFDLEEFAGDLDNYKDEQHYLPKTNQEILDRIARNENRLTLDNVKIFENQFIDILNHYSVYTSYKENYE